MKRIIETALIFSLLAGCGTRDYEKPPPDFGPPTPPRQNETRADPYAQPRLTTEPPAAGYAWRGLKWVGIPSNMINDVKCAIADSPQSSRTAAFGTALISGAVIGVVGKFNDAWLFVTKDDPHPPGDWFWNNLDVTIKKFFGGATRGAIYLAACETMMAGGNLTWFSGVLGQNYSAASTAAAIGIFSAIAGAPLVQKRFGSPPGPPIILPSHESPPSYNGFADYSGKVFTHLRDWSRNSDIGRGIRYKFVPGVLILGIGGGLGYLVYDRLAGEGPPDPACRQGN